MIDLTVPPDGVGSAPESVDILLTGKCNLKCQYCYYADNMASKADLPTERWLSFFSELGDLGVKSVRLSGGEIFMRPDIYTLIDGLIENKMRYGIVTNGTLINEGVIEAIGIGKRRIRLDSIQVSIDGSCADIHDRSRPPRSFDMAINGLKLLKKANFPVTVRVTLNHYNISDLPSIASLLLDDIGLRGFSTNEAEAMGTARCSGGNIILSPEERKKAMRILTQLNEKYNGKISADAGPLSRARMVKEIDDLRAVGKNGITGRGTLCSCGGVFVKMAILHDGTMVPCVVLPSLTMGVIGMHSLKNTWLTSPAINAVRMRQLIPLSSLDECKDCQYTGFCTGGCPASVMSKSGRLIGIDPLSCYREYLREEKLA